MDIFRACFEQSPEAIAVVQAEPNGDGLSFRYVAVNDSFVRDSGLSRDAVVGAQPVDIVPTQQALVLLHHMERCLQGADKVEFEHEFQTPTGNRTWHVRMVRDDSGMAPGTVLVFARDITWSRDLSQQLTRIADYLPGFVYQLSYSPDQQWRFLFVGKRVEAMFGITVEETLRDANALLGRIHPDDAERVINSSVAAGQAQKPWHCEFRMLRPDGLVLWVEAYDLSQKLADGTILWTGYVNDISEKKALETSLKASEERYRIMARFDALTGLLNRSEFMFQLEQSYERIADHGGKLALLFVDLDHFKPVNDGYGHATGDELLRHVARRLQSVLRSSDLVARIGGDEFTVVLDRVSDAREAERIAEKLINVLSEPFAFNGLSLTVTASIGVALGPVDGSSLHDLINAADQAMYRAKANGRNRVLVADQGPFQQSNAA